MKIGTAETQNKQKWKMGAETWKCLYSLHFIGGFIILHEVGVALTYSSTLVSGTAWCVSCTWMFPPLNLQLSMAASIMPTD